MKELNLPHYSFRIQGKEGSETIFDPVRRKYVRLTDEEWVRQNFISYLVNEGKYPPGLIGVETFFIQNKLRKRMDIVVHNRRGEPVMIVECKAPDITIDDQVFDQIVKYNMELKVPYIVVTNGLVIYACRVDHERKDYEFLLVLPLYEELTEQVL